MKAIKIITHPYLLILSFLLIVISGEHWGGFYALYLLLALLFGGLHAVLGTIGIILLLFSYHKYKRLNQYTIESLLNIAGVVLLMLSIFFFFYNDKQGYNYGTFYQVIPQVTLILFSLLALIFLGYNIYKCIAKKDNGSNMAFRKA